MKPGRHAADDGSFGRSASGAMLRGVALIALAVVLGIILLRATEAPDVFDASSEGRFGAGGSSTTITTAPSQQTSMPPTTLETIDPSTITVLVANGGGVAGLAASLTEQIAAEGYQTVDPTDSRPVDSSIVYYTTGFEDAAESLAALFDPAPEVAPLPDPSPVDDLETANVVLVAGAELAPEE